MKKTILHGIALATVLVSLATPVAASDDGSLAPADPDSTIVETAIAAGSFETLVAAIQGRRPGRGAERRGAVHGLRADRRRLRSAP